MRPALSNSEISRYRAQGFLVVPDLLSSDEVLRWTEAVDTAVAQRGTDKLAEAGAWPDEGGYYDQVFVQRINLWMDNQRVRDLLFDRELSQMAAVLAGVDGLRVWHDQALIKPPWGNPTAWHLDTPFWSFFSPDAISVWIALDDATIENGCLHYLPGTHLLASYDHVSLDGNVGDLFATYPDWAQREATAVPLSAGSCVFHNGLIAHAAGPNMTPSARRAMTCAYMPDGSTFNGQQSVLPAEYAETLAVGDVINDDRYVPLLWPNTDHLQATQGPST